MPPSEHAAKLERDGFSLVQQVFSSSITDQLIDCLTDGEAARSERRGETYGARNLFGLERVKQTAGAVVLQQFLIPLLGQNAHAVRAIYFDKTPNANWPVAWHQDLSLALMEQRELPGWTNWTIKRGVPHVQAPRNVLGKMVTARIHLDDCPAENGALRVVPQSHRQGILSRTEITARTEPGHAITVTAKRGDVLLMRPLLLHASSPAQNPSHRRVLHFEFAPANLLPKELNWAEAA